MGSIHPADNRDPVSMSMPTCKQCIAGSDHQLFQLCQELRAKGSCLLANWQQDQARQAILTVILKGLEAGARPAELAQLLTKVGE